MQLPSSVKSLPPQLPPVAATASSPAPDATVVEDPGDTAEVAAELATPDAVSGGGGDRTTSGAANPGTGEGGGGDGGGGRLKAIPRYESNPLPHYPRLARQNHWEGTVRLRALVTASGDVEGLTLERSSGHAVLDHSALDGVRRWRFIPATRGGVPIPCEVSIPVAFRLRE
jgi:protein TonB